MDNNSLNPEACYIGLDLGTTNLKAAAISSGEGGNVLATVSAAMEYDSDGARVEFEAGGFYDKVCGIIKDVSKGLRPMGVCISSASGNTVLLGADGNPLIPVISWLDTRASGDIEAVFGHLEDPADVYSIVGWPLGDYFPLAHLSMIKRVKPGLIESAAKIGMSSDYINMRLCGAWAIDHSTATTFYLQDQVAKSWNKRFLGKLGISEQQLPNLLPTGTKIGEVSAKAAAETQLPLGTPVFLGSFDHPSAAIGAGVTKEGKLLLSCGTSWVGFTPVRGRERVISASLLCDPFLESEGLWGSLFSLSNASQHVDKFLDVIIPECPQRHKKFDELAMQSEPGAGGLTVDIYGKPPADLAKYKPSDVARAIMEDVARLIAQKIDMLRDYGIAVDDIVMAGGPSHSPIWPGIVSDAVGMPLKILPNGAYAGAIGAATIAKTRAAHSG